MKKFKLLFCFSISILISGTGIAQLLDTHGVFIGTVIKKEIVHLKNGTFDKITFEIDSIIKIDSHPLYEKFSWKYGYLNNSYFEAFKKGKCKTISTFENKGRVFFLRNKYLVHLDCCYGDGYYANPDLTLEIEDFFK